MSQRRIIVLFVGIIGLVGGLWGLLVHRPTEEGRCRLRRKVVRSPAANQLIGFAWQSLPAEAVDSNQITGNPEDSSGPVKYQMVTAGEEIQMGLAYSGTPTLLVDGNGNGSLSDERGIAAKRVSLGRWDQVGMTWCRYGPIHITRDSGDEQASACIYALCQMPESARDLFRYRSARRLFLYPADYRYGKVRLGKQRYAVAVVDGDYDGCFNSVVSVPVEDSEVALPWNHQGRRAAADIFAIDYDRDGQFEMSPFGSPEVMPLGRLMRLQDRYYALDVARDDSRISLEAVEPTMGHLVLGPTKLTMELKLWSDATYQYLRSGNHVDLPAGNYQATHATLILLDPERNEWRYLMHPTARGPLTHIKIHSDQTTRVAIGPPFQVTTDIQQLAGNTLSIRPVLRGRGGESYFLVSKNYRPRWSDIVLRIVAEDGTDLIDDTSAAGIRGASAEWNEWGYWQVPADFKGKFQVQVDVDLGPFEVTHERPWHTIDN